MKTKLFLISSIFLFSSFFADAWFKKNKTEEEPAVCIKYKSVDTGLGLRNCLIDDELYGAIKRGNRQEVIKMVEAITGAKVVKVIEISLDTVEVHVTKQKPYSPNTSKSKNSSQNKAEDVQIHLTIINMRKSYSVSSKDLELRYEVSTRDKVDVMKYMRDMFGITVVELEISQNHVKVRGNREN